mgnify:CR=1 FL=1
MSLRLTVLVFCLSLFCGPVGADEIFLGGKDFLLSGERSSDGREVQTYLPYGATERDWEQRIEVHYYPKLRQPRRVLMVFLESVTRAVGEVCKMMGVQPGEGGGGFRLISNAGEDAIQEVPHLHFHVVGGRGLGRILQPAAD